MKIDNKWFFTDLSGFYKSFLLVFIKGDMIVLLPLLLMILLLGFISLKFMLIILGAYISIRYFGEMIYWLLVQFGEKKYRPGDFGFVNLSNKAIYVIYQTIAIFWTVFGITLAIYSFLYIK